MNIEKISDPNEFSHGFLDCLFVQMQRGIVNIEKVSDADEFFSWDLRLHLCLNAEGHCEH